MTLAACAPSTDAAGRAGDGTAGATGQKLLYVSDGTFGNVYAFSYPGAKLVGELTHLQTPEGVCHDEAGDIYIVTAGNATISEYAHGGSQPIKTLSDSAGTPLGCAIDPASGDLAVVNQSGPSGGSGLPNVAVYKHARGRPATYSDKNASALYFCAYDDAGNLFVDGASSAGGNGLLVELPKGQTKFAGIALDKSLNPSGGVQWDGKYLDVGDRSGSSGHADVYRLLISSGKGKTVYSTPLDGDNDIVSFWIEGRTIVGGDLIAGSVMYWHYPGGGNATKSLMGFSDPVAMTVSI
ncbi:MAG TPA: hypothetical protein VKR56_02980 [Candidatus Cybelea sp.]|nr:hypothetical protein [Candidatus Cybelea sp.]